MPPEVEETTAPDDIRSALAAAITEHEEPAEAPAPKVEAKEAPELPLEDKTETRDRDEAGKFKKKAAADADEAEKPEVVAAEKPEAEGDKEKPEAADDKNPLSPDFQRSLASWKQADRDMFKALVPDAQQFVMRRYKEMNADYVKKVQDVSRLKTDYDPVDKIFEPHRDVMKQKGFTPASLIEAWSNVEQKLASGKQGTLEVIAGLARGYNVSPNEVAAALGVRGQPAAPGVQPTETQPQQPQAQLPPELIRELTNLRQQVTGLTAAQQAAQDAARTQAGDKAMQEIEQFKSAVDDKGTLLRPHFEDIEQDMVNLANSYMQAKKPVPPLSELYETAVWANKATRERMLTAQAQSEQQKQADQAKAKSAAARKASASVTGAPGTGQAQSVRSSPERSLREELEAHVAEQSAA